MKAGSHAPIGVASSGRIIVIGSSTGGVDALLEVLSDFPSDCPPIVVVQHTGFGYGEGLVQLFQRNLPMQVELASDGLPVQPGRVVVVAGMRAHARVDPGHRPRISLCDSEPVNGHRPSVDVLFDSVVPVAPLVSAALLTGMGRDGAAGLLRLKQAGAFTVAQNRETSTVYGMPRAAVELGAACLELPLSEIAAALMRGRPRARGLHGMVCHEA